MYFDGDIVEIITSKYKSYSDVPSHEIGYYQNQGQQVPFIGQRFRIYCLSTFGDQTAYAKHGESGLQLGTNVNNLMIYKRPFKNHIKHLKLLIKKLCQKKEK